MPDWETPLVAEPRKLQRPPAGVVPNAGHVRKSGSPEAVCSRARTLDGLDVDQHLRDPSLKQGFVTPMFDVIAPRYDEFTRKFSFGMDAGWKRELLADAAALAAAPRLALDVACGTGDLASAVAAQWPGVQVRGIDASEQMVGLARKRHGHSLPHLSFEVGDLMKLQLADGSVDLITAGYALRNTPNWRAAVGELARVLRPGGVLVTLDFYRPTWAPWRVAFLAYLRLAGDWVGWRWHGRAVVYGYIARSIATFTTSSQFSEVLVGAGFEPAKVRRHLLGGVAIHAVIRR